MNTLFIYEPGRWKLKSTLRMYPDSARGSEKAIFSLDCSKNSSTEYSKTNSLQTTEVNMSYPDQRTWKAIATKF